MTPPPAASFGLKFWRGLGHLGGPAARLWLKRRIRRGKEDPARVGERFGEASLPRPKGPLVWIHAASVGESLTGLILAEALRERNPDLHVLITTVTVTAASMLESRAVPGVLHQYAPLDLPGGARRFLDHWRPDLGVWIESELWPTLILDAAGRGIPLILANARISARSASRWRRFAPGAAESLLGRFGAILAQTPEVSARFVGLGAPPRAVSTAGNLKSEAGPPPHDPAELKKMRKALAGRPVWLAASTHAGEEIVMAQAHKRLAEATPDLTLILAPRHPERGEAVAREVEAYGRRSQGDSPDQPGIYLADTLGEMGLWMRLAPVAVMGGSFTLPGGGHNPMEPASLGTAVVTGPLTHNAEADYARLTAAGGAMQIASAEKLTFAVSLLLADGAAEAKRMGAAAKEAAMESRGALAATLRAVESLAPEILKEG
ncbi:3-deoxy-D-manno-octulosonic acid transferase [Neomegalonema sp.]|uniref:3-deoxy-D-manno-octulosonic acid transferase n=1 Tax=Neomegalonema sp. TaxID=2039713 RepID=UPI00262E7111|nr:3-deoxy-D-manno-octulosonic acid transferase [Neomegalonema sp.]MDD2867981.1 3-deoxy-D-manno-octulosonic acid transferase [Neomegalonema sp.]